MPKTYNARQIAHLRAQDAHVPWGEPGPDVTRFIRFFPRAPLQQRELMVQMKAPASLWRGLFID